MCSQLPQPDEMKIPKLISEGRTMAIYSLQLMVAVLRKTRNISGPIASQLSRFDC
jgi:hypothetical protein